jgi:hypothetical protein
LPLPTPPAPPGCIGVGTPPPVALLFTEPVGEAAEGTIGSPGGPERRGPDTSQAAKASSMVEATAMRIFIVSVPVATCRQRRCCGPVALAGW